jgi:cell division protein FtsN
MKPYYELVFSRRQLAGLLAVLLLLLVVSFLLGVGVGLGQREAAQQALPVTVAQAPSFAPTPTPVGSSPSPEPTSPSAPAPGDELPAAATPSPFGQATPPPTATPSPSPSRTPEPLPIVPPKATPEAAPTASPGHSLPVWVQVAAVSKKADAEGVRLRVVALGFRPEQVRVVPWAEGKYRVRVGPFPDKESGARVVARLRAGGFPQAFLVNP